MRKNATLGRIAAVLAVTLAGCTAQQLADDEARAHAALVSIAQGADWLVAHKAEVDAALDVSIAAAKSNPTLQAKLQGAKDHFDAGDVAYASGYIALGAAAFAPAAPVVSTAPK